MQIVRASSEAWPQLSQLRTDVDFAAFAPLRSLLRRLLVRSHALTRV